MNIYIDRTGARASISISKSKTHAFNDNIYRAIAYIYRYRSRRAATYVATKIDQSCTHTWHTFRAAINSQFKVIYMHHACTIRSRSPLRRCPPFVCEWLCRACNASACRARWQQRCERMCCARSKSPALASRAMFDAYANKRSRSRRRLSRASETMKSQTLRVCFKANPAVHAVKWHSWNQI